MIEAIIVVFIFIVMWFGTICTRLASIAKRTTGKSGIELVATAFRRGYRAFRNL
ncbi:TPA: hypothetical protein SMF39_004537 [Serratia marcescens]|nr:hypothetical protein [Serratia marcescens]